MLLLFTPRMGIVVAKAKAVAEIAVWFFVGSENDQHQHLQRRQLSNIKCSSNKKKDVEHCLLLLFVVVVFRLGF